jgi:uncharacterized protein YfbU (UPF0304 family)
MAVLNVRVEDRVRDQLRMLAHTQGVSLSEYVRDLLLEAVVPVHDDRTHSHGDEPAPESIRTMERQTLALLHRILARVLPEGANDVDGDTEYQLERATILEEGFTGEYWHEVAGLRTELSKRDCDRVSDILQLFRILTFSIEELTNDGVIVDPGLVATLEYRGFDHNDALEGHMASYVAHLMSDDRWKELQPHLKRHDGGNSHSPMLQTYGRMLTEYRRLKDTRQPGIGRHDYLLSSDELQQIADARFRSTP